MKRHAGEHETSINFESQPVGNQNELKSKEKNSKKSSLFCCQVKALIFKSFSLQMKQVMTNIFQFLACFIIILMVYITQREMTKLFREDYNFDKVNTIPMFMNLPSGFFQSSQAYPIQKSDCFIYYQYKDHTTPASSEFTPNDLMSPLFREYCPRKQLFVPYIQKIDDSMTSNELVVQRMREMEDKYPMKFGREREGLDRVPDALIDFREISRDKLSFKIQINDNYYIEYHRNNGFTKTSFKIPEKSMMDKFKEMFDQPQSIRKLLDQEGRLEQLRDTRDSIYQLKDIKLGGIFDYGRDKLNDYFEARKRHLKEGKKGETPPIDLEASEVVDDVFDILKRDNPEIDFEKSTLRHLIDKQSLLLLLDNLVDFKNDPETYKRLTEAVNHLYAHFKSEDKGDEATQSKPEESEQAAETGTRDSGSETETKSTNSYEIDGRILEASGAENPKSIEELLTSQETIKAAQDIIDHPEKVKFNLLDKLKQKSSSFPQVNPTEGIVIAEDFLMKNYLRKVAPQLSIVSAISYIQNIGTKDSIFNAVFASISSTLLPLALIGHFSVFLYHFKLERYQKTRHLMILHGLRPFTYWIVGYLFSFLMSLVSGIIFVVCTRLILKLPIFVSTAPGLLLLTYALWSHSQVSMAILFQNVPVSPQMASIFAYIISVFNLVGSTYVNSNIFLSPVTIPFYLRIVPELSFTRIIQYMSVSCLHDKCYKSFSEMPPLVIRSFWYLFGISTLYLVLGLCIDLGLFSCLSRKQRKQVKSGHASGDYSLGDKGSFKVTQEIKDEVEKCSQISQHGQSTPSLLVTALTKSFKTTKGRFKAVNNLSFNVQKNSIFGLLGPNGAGKTTLMKMITSLEVPDKGDIQVEGLNIKDFKDTIHRILGVCPQFDCLYPELTVEEHFLLFIRLRGVPGRREQDILARTLKQMGLEEHRHKRVSQLSGGMKRRVSIGIALCGETKLVLLDEPTSGLDPVNRQQIWAIVNNLKTTRAILLTTHLMDEAEALCDRVGIILKGQLMTIGTQGFLKSKYARGIHLNVKFVKADVCG